MSRSPSTLFTKSVRPDPNNDNNTKNIAKALKRLESSHDCLNKDTVTNWITGERSGLYYPRVFLIKETFTDYLNNNRPSTTTVAPTTSTTTMAPNTIAPTTSTTTTTVVPTTTCGYCLDKNNECSLSLFNCKKDFGSVTIKDVIEVPDEESNNHWILN